MQMFRISRSAPVRRPAARLAGVATAGALAATLALAAPAEAADPAVEAEAMADTNFTVDAGCDLVTGDNDDDVLTSVQTSGTKKLSASGTGTATATDSGDPTDTVTMKATNTVTGSVTASGGAFKKAAFAMNQGGTITMSQGFSTSCSPAAEIAAAFGMAFTVKKAGRLSIRLDLPRDTLVEVQLTQDGSPAMMALAYNARGGYATSRAVVPGSYTLLVQSTVVVGVDGGPQILLNHSGKVGVTVGYSKS